MPIPRETILQLTAETGSQIDWLRSEAPETVSALSDHPIGIVSLVLGKDQPGLAHILVVTVVVGQVDAAHAEGRLRLRVGVVRLMTKVEVLLGVVWVHQAHVGG